MRLARKIEKGNREDPILKQFAPHPEEALQNTLYSADPVGDQQSRCAPKSLKKYDRRILLLTTQACAMHCRYCFRQNFAYAKQKEFALELDQIKADNDLREVILSGGDPLSLSDRVLKELVKELSFIPHLKRLRFHTRFPIGIPERITQEFLKILSDCPLQTWFVIHCNHPRELDSDVLAALKSIQRLGIPVLNQAVLLRGVNDTIEILQELCERLADNGIQPYYLHQLDRVQGAARYEVTQEEGRRLIEELRKRLSGYAVPAYVQEIAGKPSKTPLLFHS
ncbi:MAG: KamA family radical SAM protein [Chlamydiales bacterium]|nr:KamA family radical SAM protein [Chlamydiales bacterium]